MRGDPCGLCGGPTRIRYPGGEPDNGPARPYCDHGHSTCYRCAGWFQAIVPTGGFTDEETGLEIPPSSYESDWCEPCEEEHRKDYCGCGSDKTHTHYGYACCGSKICCEDME